MKGPPEPSVSDVHKWRKLVKAARAQAAAPQSFGGDLYKAAKGCRLAVIPPAHCVRNGVFQRLQLLGLQFASYHPDQRAAKAADLVELGDAVEAALNAGSPNPTPTAPAGVAREPRKDVFG